MEYGLYAEGNSFGEAWKKLNHQAFTGEPEHYSSNAHYFNCLMVVKDPSIEDINLGYIGYTKAKFRNLINLYWDEEQARHWVTRLHHYKNIDSEGKRYVVSLALKFNTRENRTGSCLQYISLGKSPQKGWMVFVRTRANEIAQRLYADMVLVQLILKKITDILDIPLNEVTVYWTIDAVYQSVIGCNLWLAMTYPPEKIREFMSRPDEQLTRWQTRVKKRYLKNFNLDEDERKEYNYSVQKRATVCFDKIVNDDIEVVPEEELMEMLTGLEVDKNLYDNLFNTKGGCR